MLIKKVGVLYHPLNEAAGALAGKLQDFLRDHSVDAWACSAWEGEKIRAGMDGTDLLLTIGGDGTILRAAQSAVAGGSVIVGINMGKLGFMTELAADNVEAELARLLAGEGWLDERATLEAQYGDGTFCALNDVVVARGAAARTISVEVTVNDERLAGYRADGVVVATATGSTGYALAANGPILNPQSQELLLVPVTPHLSSEYTLVLPATAVISLHLNTTHSATLSVDGHINSNLSGGATITVKHSSHTVRFLRIHPETSFYGSLEQRLKGKH